MFELRNQINATIEKYLESQSAEQVSADRLGLDPRSGSVFVGPDFIARKGGGSFEYYSGFDYIKADDKMTAGDYTIYSNDANRVQEALDFFNGRVNHHEEDEE